MLEIYRSYLSLFSRLQIDRRLRGKVSSSDLIQDTFLQAQGDFPHFHGNTEEELVEWLRKILVFRLAKVVRQYYKTRRRDVRLEQQLAEELDQSTEFAASLISQKSSPSQEASRREEAMLLADALGKLQDDYREVIILRNLEELSFPEIGQQMGRSEEAVKTWARALAALRKVLGNRPRDTS